MKSFAAKSRRDSKAAAVNGSASSSCCERRDVASGTADLVEERFAVFGFGSFGERNVPSGRFRGAHEAGEVIDVGEAVCIGLVVGLGDCVAEIGDLVGLQPAGDAHFIEISVRGERQEAGLLIFPAKAAYAGLAGGFDDGNVKSLAANSSVVFLALILREIEESLIGQGFDKPITQNIERDAEGSDFFGIRDVLLDFGTWESAAGTDGSIVDERAVLDDFGAVVDGDFRIPKHAMGIEVADTQFGNLAGAASGGILVALAAGLRVVKRAKAVRDCFYFFELGLIGGVGRVVDQTVASVVKTSGRLGKRRCEGKKTNRQTERNAGKQPHRT